MASDLFSTPDPIAERESSLPPEQKVRGSNPLGHTNLSTTCEDQPSADLLPSTPASSDNASQTQDSPSPEPEYVTQIHLCLDLRGFIKNTRYPGGYVGVFTHDDGRKMEPSEARDMLLDFLSEGKKVIPCAPCDNFDFQKGCLGHRVPAEGGAA